MIAGIRFGKLILFGSEQQIKKFLQAIDEEYGTNELENMMRCDNDTTTLPPPMGTSSFEDSCMEIRKMVEAMKEDKKMVPREYPPVLNRKLIGRRFPSNKPKMLCRRG